MCKRSGKSLLDSFPSSFKDVFHYYRAYLHRLNQIGMGDYLVYRWLMAIVGGVACGGWVFWKSLNPVGGIRHIKGKELLEGNIAYRSLKREFGFLCPMGRVQAW